MRVLAERLVQEHRLTADEYRTILSSCDGQTLDFLRENAARIAQKQFGFGVYVRGLIEVSSYCRNGCYYCGLRSSNKSLQRYRLTPDEILGCCDAGYNMGFRTFVLQGGEDPALTDEMLVPLVRKINKRYPDCAITLSLGERSGNSYEQLFEAGASRYLLRHETAQEFLYSRLHPQNMSWHNRMDCIRTLRNIGYQVGMGMMIGVPGQTIDTLVEDILLMEELEPHMIGIGPFLPHSETPLGYAPAGSLCMTLLLLAMLRIIFPAALIPATTALATLSPTGRIEGVKSGANVVMPNLTPSSLRKRYAIYENKASYGAEAAEGLSMLEKELSAIGYHIDYSKGDYQKNNEYDEI